MQTSNPFFHRGRPIRDPVYFYGRRTEIRQSMDLLRNLQSMSIVGPRRIGKTSFAHYLSCSDILARHGLIPERYSFVYANCEGWANLEASDIYRELWEEMAEALDASNRQVATVSGPVAPITYRAFDQALRALTRQGIHVIFILDEFEVLCANQRLDAAFFTSLRGLATRHNVAYVTVSTAPLHELNYIETSTLSSPFFNIFATMRLALFHATEAEELLAGIAAKAGVTFLLATMRFLLDLAGPHPLLLQIAGYHAFELRASPHVLLNDDGHEYIRRHFLNDAEPHWIYAWDKLSDDERKILALLPVAGEGDRITIQRLEDACLVVRREGRLAPLSASFQEFVSRQNVPGLLQTLDLTLDISQQIALLRGRRLALPTTEFRLLACLIERAGQVVSHSELESRVWPDDKEIDDPQRLRLKTAIKTLRRTLDEDGDRIQNVRSVGYKYALP